MTSFTYTVTQEVHYYGGVEFDSPEQVIAWIETGDGWDDSKNEVVSDRIRVYDESGALVADTVPDVEER